MTRMSRRSLLAGMAVGAGLGTRGLPVGPASATDGAQSKPGAPAVAQAAGRQRALDAFPYRQITVPGSSALKEWIKLRVAGNGWPVIVGDRRELTRVAEQFSWNDPAVNPSASAPDRSVAQILEAARSVRLPDDLMRLQGMDAGDAHMPPQGSLTEPPAEPRGLEIIRELGGEFVPEVSILEIPTDKSYEVPAYLKWGNWNACPPPEVHVAVLRSWHERFGVEVVGISGDSMDLFVLRPPSTFGEAMKLALEEYTYCNDMIDQGAGTVSRRAAELMADPWWDLWWD